MITKPMAMASPKVSCLVLAALLLGGCNYTDSGGGSGTLTVSAEVIHHANNDVCQLRVHITDTDGRAVDDAEVIFTDDANGETIELTVNPGHRYAANIDGYRRHLRLSVERGEDELHGAIEGPAPHRITKPVNARTRAVTRDLTVEWATEDGVRADQVVIRLNLANFSTVLTDDPGSYEIPQSYLEVGSGPLAVERRNSVVLNGGIGGSSLTLGTSVENDVIIEDR